MIGDGHRKCYNVLFLCARNSARSIIAEALLNRLGAGRFEGFSAGFDPAADLSPYAMTLLHRINYNTSLVTPKGLDTLMSKWAPALDFVIRLSPDLSSGRSLPPLPGNPPVIDWPMSDPSEIIGSKAAIAAAYEDMFNTLSERIDVLCRMPAHMLENGRAADCLERLGEAHHRLAS